MPRLKFMPVLCAAVAFLIAQGSTNPTILNFDGYTIVRSDRPGNRYDKPAHLVIKDRAGTSILTVTDWSTEVEWVSPLGTSKTPVAAISTFTGGAHYCETDYFVRLGDNPVLLGKFEMGNVAALQAKKRPGTRIFDVVTDFDGFAYYHASYADSAHVPLVFWIEGDRLVECTESNTQLLTKAFKDSCRYLARQIKAYETALNRKEADGGGLFGNGYGGAVVQVYAVSLLLHNDKEAEDFLARQIYRKDREMLNVLKPEIAKILASRAARITYPKLPFVHQGDY